MSESISAPFRQSESGRPSREADRRFESFKGDPMSREFSVVIEGDKKATSSRRSHPCQVVILRPDRSTSLWTGCERQLLMPGSSRDHAGLGCGGEHGRGTKRKRRAAHRQKLVAEKKYAEGLRHSETPWRTTQRIQPCFTTPALRPSWPRSPRRPFPTGHNSRPLKPPDNWRLRAKLVQAYEAAGLRKERDAKRAELLRLRKETKDEQWKEEKFFWRSIRGGQDARHGIRVLRVGRLRSVPASASRFSARRG